MLGLTDCITDAGWKEAQSWSARNGKSSGAFPKSHKAKPRVNAARARQAEPDVFISTLAAEGTQAL